MPGLRLELRLSEELVGKLDAARGLVPRATFARDALERALGFEVRMDPVPAAAVPVAVTAQVRGPFNVVSSAEAKGRG